MNITIGCITQNLANKNLIWNKHNLDTMKTLATAFQSCDYIFLGIQESPSKTCFKEKFKNCISNDWVEIIPESEERIDPMTDFMSIFDNTVRSIVEFLQISKTVYLYVFKKNIANIPSDSKLRLCYRTCGFHVIPHGAFKGANIYTQTIGADTTLCVVNTHLYYTSNEAFRGIEGRTEQFNKILDYIAKHIIYGNKYILIFMGDLNFRITWPQPIGGGYHFQEEDKNRPTYKYIKDYFGSKKHETGLKTADQLSNFDTLFKNDRESNEKKPLRPQTLRRQETKISNYWIPLRKDFRKKLLGSLPDNLPLTCKLYQDATSANMPQDFELIVGNVKQQQKIGKHLRLPSNCDKIMWATSKKPAQEQTQAQAQKPLKFQGTDHCCVFQVLTFTL